MMFVQKSLALVVVALCLTGAVLAEDREIERKSFRFQSASSEFFSIGSLLILEHNCEALNATWTSDGVCPEGCDKPSEPMLCTLQLVEGCFCAEGYVREHTVGGCGPIEQEPDECGRCVRKENCPSNYSSTA